MGWKVKLRGIKPVSGEKYSDVERDGAILILDVGGETIFRLKHLETVNGEVILDLEDFEGNDVASLLIETGCAAASEEKSKNITFIFYTKIAN